MNDTLACVVFRITGDIYDEYLGVAADLRSAIRLCMDDQKKKLEGWQGMARWRAANLRANDLTPVIDLDWYEDSDGDYRTSDASTFVNSYDRGYHIVIENVAGQH